MKVSVDRSMCIGSGMCATLAPDVFALDEAGRSVVLVPEPSGELEGAAADASACCPTEAIHVEPS